jgi:hypothetical protein
MKMAPSRPWKEFCRSGTIVFFATLVDEAGAASLDFSDRVDGYRGIRTTYGVNDEIPSQNSFRNINIPTDSSSSPSAATSKGWSGWI